MIVRIGKFKVDVLHAKCGEQSCFGLGFDKGIFSQGRGYTSYHKKERPVCMTRHLHGCPTVAVCLKCRTSIAPGETRCSWCKIGGDDAGKTSP